MIVSIAPSDIESKARSVTLELPYDDVSVEDAVKLVKDALVAYGFEQANIFEDDE